MQIEATQPVKIRLNSEQTILLKRGQRWNLPDDMAEKLIAKSPHRIRIVPDPPDSAPAASPDPMADPTQEPEPCPRCREARFWCQTCNAVGHWVCGCSHPRLAQHIAQSPPIPARLTPGAVVAWHSPQWGLLRGVYLAPVGRRQVRVHHPLTQREAIIPTAWLCDANGAEHAI